MESRYKVGDVVYFMDGQRIAMGEIEAIHFYVMKGHTATSYKVKGLINPVYETEDNVIWASLDELIDNLKKQYCREEIMGPRLYKLETKKRYDFLSFNNLFKDSDDVEGYIFGYYGLPKCTSMRKRKKRIKRLMGRNRKVFFLKIRSYNKLLLK
jgi:hypothetical protein